MLTESRLDCGGDGMGVKRDGPFLSISLSKGRAGGGEWGSPPNLSPAPPPFLAAIMLHSAANLPCFCLNSAVALP
eukprot:5988142-Karenia_brevis.AAC.1